MYIGHNAECREEQVMKIRFITPVKSQPVRLKKIGGKREKKGGGGKSGAKTGLIPPYECTVKKEIVPRNF